MLAAENVDLRQSSQARGSKKRAPPIESRVYNAEALEQLKRDRDARDAHSKRPSSRGRPSRAGPSRGDANLEIASSDDETELEVPPTFPNDEDPNVPPSPSASDIVFDRFLDEHEAAPPVRQPVKRRDQGVKQAAPLGKRKRVAPDLYGTQADVSGVLVERPNGRHLKRRKVFSPS
jgi:hypothetical protein